MNLQLKQTSRSEAKIRLLLKGCSSSGKSMGALNIAKGLCNGDLSKVAVIDSECSASLYSHLGNFNVLNLSQPFSFERYIQSIDICEKAGMELIIIDSCSQLWVYLLQLHANMQGNSFLNWSRIMPLHSVFIQRIQQSPCHIICTARSKLSYHMFTKDGKVIIEKIGMKAIQKNDVDYEFTTVLDLSINHQAKATKDRTGLFMYKPEFIITENTGILIRNWCNVGISNSVPTEQKNINIQNSNHHGNHSSKQTG